MAFAETTNPDIVNQFGETGVAPAQLRAQIESAWARIGKAPKRRAYAPQWEDPGVHGSAKQVSLRGARLTSSAIGRGRQALPARARAVLPPLPTRGMSAGKAALIAGAVLGAGALAWYLWKRRPAVPTQPVAVGDDYCGFDELGCD